MMAPPNYDSYHGPASDGVGDGSSGGNGGGGVVYERHGHYTTTTTTTARVGTGTSTTTGRPTYTTPTKPAPTATATAAGPNYKYGGTATATTPGTVVDESFDSAAMDDDLNSELAIADDGHENGISHEQRSSQVIAAANAAANNTIAPGAGPYAHNGGSSSHNSMTAHARAGVRDAPVGPVGYQVPAGGGVGGDSNASLKSGVPRHSPIPAGPAAARNIGNNGAAASAPVVTAPPLMSIKTKKKKSSSSSSRSKKYEDQIAAEAAVARYYAEEEPYDVGGADDEMRINDNGGRGGIAGADGHGDGYDDSRLRQPRPVRPTAAATAVNVNAAMMDSRNLPTNPFDDSFDTAAVSNIAAGAVNSSTAHNPNPNPNTTSKAGAARGVNDASDYNGSSVPSTPTSAIKAVKARQQRLQQEQQQRRILQQQQRQREQQRASSTDSASNNNKDNNKSRGGGNSGMNAHASRAEKTPTPTNANLSVPRAPSNASTHVGPLDEMTIMSAETGESWKRAEEEFAAAEAAARRERASWEQQGRLRSHDENDDEDEDDEDEDFAAAAAVAAATAAGKKQQAAAAAATTPATAGGNKRQGILKTSSARTKPVGRNHPWDRKSSAGGNADANEEDEDDNTLFEFEDEASKKQRAGLKASRERKRAERRSSAGEGIKKSMSHDSAMSGSSFGRRRSGGGTRARRGRSYDDDESLSTAGPSLQGRTQEAWKRKNAVPRTRSAPRAGRSGSAVAFAQDTIHHFENDDESTVYTKESIYTKDSQMSARNNRRGRRDDEAYSDDDTYNSRRTTGTDYSGAPKSYESEVEDLVKDFLFIGRGDKSQPGSKRKKSHYKKDRYRDEESTYNDDGTIATYDESTYGGTRDESTFVTRDESTYVSRDSRTSVDDQTYESADPSLVKEKKMKSFFSSKRSARVDDDDGTLVTEMSVDVVKKSGPCGQEKPCGDDNPLAAVWEFMEGGIDAMSQALGMSGDAKQQEGTTASNSISRGQSTNGAKRSATADAAAGLAGLVDFASDYVFGPAPSRSQDTGVSTDEAPSSRHITPTHSLDASMDKEAGLVELSLCAAKAKHMTAGVPFNESAEIDVVNDIKFNVITTALPLGLLFQENSAGCWVAKIFATGNAANAAFGKGVQVGDQLAAVNGNSTIKLTVDEVCDMISSSPNTNEIELTFLRYVGPLQSNKKRGKGRSPSPIRRSKGSGLFNRSASAKPSTPAVSAANNSSSAPPPKQKKGFFGRTRSKSNPRPQAPVPSISESASSDFLGEYDGTSNMGTSQATGATGKSKKKKGFFGRKKK